jgi:hypothetical protein
MPVVMPGSSSFWLVALAYGPQRTWSLSSREFHRSSGVIADVRLRGGRSVPPQAEQRVGGGSLRRRKAAQQTWASCPVFQ